MTEHLDELEESPQRFCSAGSALLQRWRHVEDGAELHVFVTWRQANRANLKRRRDACSPQVRGDGTSGGSADPKPLMPIFTEQGGPLKHSLTESYSVSQGFNLQLMLTLPPHGGMKSWVCRVRWLFSFLWLDSHRIRKSESASPWLLLKGPRSTTGTHSGGGTAPQWAFTLQTSRGGNPVGRSWQQELLDVRHLVTKCQLV